MDPKNIADARLGTTQQITAAVGANTEQQVVPADRNRTCITLFGPSAGICWLSFGQAAAVNIGMQRQGTSVPVSFNVADHGPLAQCEIRGFSTVAGFFSSVACVAGNK